MSVNKKENVDWEDIKHIIISFINEYYSVVKKFIYKKQKNLKKKRIIKIEKKIINLLETKISPAVARDGGDIKFEEL